MTDAELVRNNAAEAFITLASNAPHAKVERTDRYWCCTSQFDHPLANFAVRLDLDPSSIDMLSNIAKDRSSFRVHVMSPDRPQTALGAFEANGLTEMYRLTLMAGAPDGELDAGVRQATASETDELIAFAVDNFFWTSPQSVRRKISQITGAAAKDPRNLSFIIEGSDGIDAIATLFFDSGTAGLYNVCVRRSLRGLGLGTRIVAHACRIAKGLADRIVLQCDPSLASWYESLGFSEVGESVTLAAR